MDGRTLVEFFSGGDLSVERPLGGETSWWRDLRWGTLGGKAPWWTDSWWRDLSVEVGRPQVGNLSVERPFGRETSWWTELLVEVTSWWRDSFVEVTS